MFTKANIRTNVFKTNQIENIFIHIVINIFLEMEIDIKKMREELKLTQQELSVKTGIPKGRINAWEQRGSQPKTDDFITLKNFFEDNKSSQNYLEKRRHFKNNTETTLNYYNIGAAAGNSADIIPVKKSEGVLHINDLFRGSQFAIRVSGNSMTPNYPPGAIIGIKEIQDKQITPGSVYVIEKGNELWIKRLFYKQDNQETGIFECVSDNTMKHEKGGREGKLFYPPFYLEVDKVRRLFKVTGIYKANELTVII